VILLDGSGSMGAVMGTQVKMEAAKAAIRNVLATLPESTQVGLLVFTQRGPQRGWLSTLGPRDDAVLLKKLATVEPGGKTPLGQYLQVAANQLLQQRTRQLGYGTYRLLVVTDGQATDMTKMLGVAPQVVSRGMVLDVIGVDMKRDHALSSMAHSYRRADDAASLRSAMAEVLAEIGAGVDDVASGEAFDLLAPLPSGTAQAVIHALTSRSDAPIGP
jgi:hypothetical protein